jgi:hypothetical protein
VVWKYFKIPGYALGNFGSLRTLARVERGPRATRVTVSLVKCQRERIEERGETFNTLCLI